MESSIRPLQLFFLAMLSGQVLILAIIWYLNTAPGLGPKPQDDSSLAWLVPLLVGVSLLGAYVLNRQRMAGAKKESREPARWNHYRGTVIMRLALLEVAVLTAAAGFLLEEKYLHLGYALIGIGAFFLFRPSTDEFQRVYAAK